MALSTKKAYVLKLTGTEKQLLSENDGCFKCWKFFVAHHSTDCPAGFPDLLTYKMLTPSNIDSTKHCQNGKPIAAMNSVTDGKVDSTAASDPLAAIIEQHDDPITYVLTNDSNVLNNTYDSLSDTDVSIPHSMASTPSTILFYSLHFYWDCVTNSPMHLMGLPCKALFDHGSHTVLVSEEFTNHLAMHQRKLPCPERVTMAMG